MMLTPKKVRNYEVDMVSFLFSFVYIFITIILIVLMCFNVSKSHYSKYNLLIRTTI
jgi:hypothetical protein